MKLNTCFFWWWIAKKYNEIWYKIRNSTKIEFHGEPVYNKKYLKAKIRSSEGKMNTLFYSNKIPKEGSQYICLSVILIDSVFRIHKNHYF